MVVYSKVGDVSGGVCGVPWEFGGGSCRDFLRKILVRIEELRDVDTYGFLIGWEGWEDGVRLMEKEFPRMMRS
jgi:hypothetical protein